MGSRKQPHEKGKHSQTVVRSSGTLKKDSPGKKRKQDRGDRAGRGLKITIGREGICVR